MTKKRIYGVMIGLLLIVFTAVCVFFAACSNEDVNENEVDSSSEDTVKDGAADNESSASGNGKMEYVDMTDDDAVFLWNAIADANAYDGSFLVSFYTEISDSIYEDGELYYNENAEGTTLETYDADSGYAAAVYDETWDNKNDGKITDFGIYRWRKYWVPEDDGVMYYHYLYDTDRGTETRTKTSYNLNSSIYLNQCSLAYVAQVDDMYDESKTVTTVTDLIYRIFDYYWKIEALDNDENVDVEMSGKIASDGDETVYLLTVDYAEKATYSEDGEEEADYGEYSLGWEFRVDSNGKLVGLEDMEIISEVEEGANNGVTWSSEYYENYDNKFTIEYSFDESLRASDEELALFE